MCEERPAEATSEQRPPREKRMSSCLWRMRTEGGWNEVLVHLHRDTLLCTHTPEHTHTASVITVTSSAQVWKLWASAQSWTEPPCLSHDTHHLVTFPSRRLCLRLKALTSLNNVIMAPNKTISGNTSISSVEHKRGSTSLGKVVRKDNGKSENGTSTWTLCRPSQR